MAECKHLFSSNSGRGGEPDFRPNRQMWDGLRMHVWCSKCGCRTWVTEGDWKYLTVRGMTTTDSITEIREQQDSGQQGEDDA